MELKVGMYVITNDRMKIGKIKGFCTCEMCEKRGFYEPIIDGDIIITDYDKSQEFHGYKFYDNLIDLIEIGDYVNGYLVTGFDYQYSSNKKVVFSNVRLDGTGIKIPAKDIKSIVTKEQFDSVKYEVE